MSKIYFDWKEVDNRLHDILIHCVTSPRKTKVYGVPRGGAIVAGILRSHAFDRVEIVPSPGLADIIVDDIIDSGATQKKFAHFDKPFLALVDKQTIDCDLGWVVFPWEDDKDDCDITDSIQRVLQYIGKGKTTDTTLATLTECLIARERGQMPTDDIAEMGAKMLIESSVPSVDIKDETICDTPARVAKALREMTIGYGDKPKEILSKTFPPEGKPGMVMLAPIEFVSICEHHLLPFTGSAAVAYIPKDRIVGLSKLARLVDCYARRMQVQERLTGQIANAMEEHLDTLGVGVVIKAKHSCMGCRGVRKPTGEMITSDLRGVFVEGVVRSEFMSLATMQLSSV